MSRTAVVTGAAGFIGRALCEALLAEGWAVNAWVRDTTRAPVGTRVVRWELNAPVPALELRGVDVVFHAAARVGDWGSRTKYDRENVDATRRLLDAAERCGVRAFVYTSTPSVILGDDDVAGVTESSALCPELLSEYARTKARAEALVLAHRGELKTMALRPHAVIGRGDRHLREKLGVLARGPVLFQFGDGGNLVHFTSLATAVRAHLAAARVLLEGRGHGQAVFVADSPPLPVWSVLRDLSRQHHGRAVPLVKVPYALVWQLARFAEWFHGPMPWWPPIINRYRVALLGRSHWFSLQRMTTLLEVRPGDAERAIREALAS